MKKILLSLTMICSGFIFGFNNSNDIEDVKATYGDYCQEETFYIMNVALDLGFSVEETTCISNAFYAECEGYTVSYDECLN
jgi:hypothetical protein